MNSPESTLPGELLDRLAVVGQVEARGAGDDAAEVDRAAALGAVLEGVPEGVGTTRAGQAGDAVDRLAGAVAMT